MLLHQKKKKVLAITKQTTDVRYLHPDGLRGCWPWKGYHAVGNLTSFEGNSSIIIPLCLKFDLPHPLQKDDPKSLHQLLKRQQRNKKTSKVTSRDANYINAMMQTFFFPRQVMRYTWERIHDPHTCGPGKSRAENWTQELGEKTLCQWPNTLVVMVHTCILTKTLRLISKIRVP